MYKLIATSWLALYAMPLLVACSSPASTAEQSKADVAQEPTRPTPTNTPTYGLNARKITVAHNKVRAQYGLSPLTWSPLLAVSAKQWAKHLQQTNGCAMRPRSISETEFGENLFWASPFTWTNGKVEVQKITSASVVKAWADEVNYYDYQKNSCQKGQQCGHYTQVVWHSTRKVGCGIAICPDKSQVWVCSYDPPGNWQGQRPY